MFFSEMTTVPVFGQSTACDFKLIADSSLLNKEFTLSKFAIYELNNKELKFFKRNIDYQRGQLKMVNYDSLNREFKNICSIKKYKLKKVKIEQDNSQEDFELFGKKYKWIIVSFYFDKK